MRKAFDANVPKLKPRLRTAAAAAASISPAEARESVAADVADEEVASPSPSGGVADEVADRGSGGVAPESDLGPTMATAGADRAAGVIAAAGASPGARASPAAIDAVHPRPAVPAAVDPAAPFGDRRERLEKIKRRVAEAARTAALPEPPPTSAAAGEAALGMVRDLERELARARERNLDLESELSKTRGELARGAAEARRAAERLAEAERAADEKRGVLEEMLAEMSALEAERDEAVRRAQALAALDEERQELVDDLHGRLEAAEKASAEHEAEAERLSKELDDRSADGARLRSALAQVTRERDDLARDAAEARRERDELLDARRALEELHHALAQARARLG